MMVRVLISAAALAAFVALAGCSDQSSTPEKATQPKTEQATTEQTRVAAPAPAPDKKLRCEDFPDREAAQKFLDVHKGTSYPKIDPDNNGKACDEGAYLFAKQTGPPASASTSASGSASTSATAPVSGDLTRYHMMQCRTNLYAREQNMSKAEADAFADKLADDIMAHGENYDVDEALDKAGVPRYTECGYGKFEEE